MESPSGMPSIALMNLANTFDPILKVAGDSGAPTIRLLKTITIGHTCSQLKVSILRSAFRAYLQLKIYLYLCQSKLLTTQHNVNLGILET